MPIEIRELHIKAVVENGSGSTGGEQSGEESRAPDEKLIKACVDRVIELIKDTKER